MEKRKTSHGNTGGKNNQDGSRKARVAGKTRGAFEEAPHFFPAPQF